MLLLLQGSFTFVYDTVVDTYSEVEFICLAEMHSVYIGHLHGSHTLQRGVRSVNIIKTYSSVDNLTDCALKCEARR